MKHLFVINPVAGGEDKTEFVSANVARAFSCREGEYEIYVTKAPMDACEKIRVEARLSNRLRVYACGGDGTLNECVNGAAGLANVAVTHFPCGTGNDFIRTFGGEADRFFDLVELIEGEVRPIDVIKCNDRYCINICSVGIDARIGTQVHKYSELPIIGGAGGYVASLVANFIRGINMPAKVTACGRSFEGEFALMCACNGRYYGGGFNPVPTARPDDGIIDFLVIKKVSRAAFVRLVVSYAKGNFRKHPNYITHLRGERMEIHCPEEIVVNLDGEAIYAKDITLTAIPGGINLICPTNMAFFENEREKSALI